jgi:hypothetical protein
MTYTAHVNTDLYQAGRTCDGHPFVAEAYYVVIENERGTRFRHAATWCGAEHLVCEETGESYFPDRREESRAKAERLCARVNAALGDGTGVDWAYWVETDPAYGSDEYIAQGTEAKRAFAERQEG